MRQQLGYKTPCRAWGDIFVSCGTRPTRYGLHFLNLRVTPKYKHKCTMSFEGPLNKIKLLNNQIKTLNHRLF